MLKFILILILAPMFEDSNACSIHINHVLWHEGQTNDLVIKDTPSKHDHTYWYLCDGIGYTFVWGKGIEGCKLTRYKFEPTCY